MFQVVHSGHVYTKIQISNKMAARHSLNNDVPFFVKFETCTVSEAILSTSHAVLVLQLNLPPETPNATNEQHLHMGNIVRPDSSCCASIEEPECNFLAEGHSRILTPREKPTQQHSWITGCWRKVLSVIRTAQTPEDRQLGAAIVTIKTGILNANNMLVAMETNWWLVADIQLINRKKQWMKQICLKPQTVLQQDHFVDEIAGRAIQMLTASCLLLFLPKAPDSSNESTTQNQLKICNTKIEIMGPHVTSEHMWLCAEVPWRWQHQHNQIRSLEKIEPILWYKANKRQKLFAHPILGTRQGLLSLLSSIPLVTCFIVKLRAFLSTTQAGGWCMMTWVNDDMHICLRKLRVLYA